MKTEDLIGALVADLTASTVPFRQALAGAVALGTIIAAGVLLSSIGIRPDIGRAIESARFLLKFAVTLSLVAAAIGSLTRLAVPGVATGRWAWAWLAAPLMLATAVVVELVALPGSAWWPSLVGSNARACLALIPLLSIGPLACILFALRQGAPTQPGLTGAVAGFLSGGVAATLYASHCADDSPLFVATWYSLAISAVALVGYCLGSRCLRW